METGDDKDLLIKRMVNKNYSLVKTLNKTRMTNWLLKASLLVSFAVIAWLSIGYP